MREIGSPYTLLASPNGDPAFAARISELFYNACRPRLAQNLPGCTEAEADMAYLFIAGGCGHLISSWIREAADQLGKICDAFLRAYYQTLER